MTRTPGEILRPMFDRGGLPMVVRMRRAWARWPAGARFLWSDICRGYLSPCGLFVLRADTVRGAPGIFEAVEHQAELFAA